MIEQLLTATEAAAKLRLHPVTLRKMAREGRVLGAIRVGGRWRFEPDCTVEPLQRPTAPEPAPRPRPAARRAAVGDDLAAALSANRPSRSSER
ncbi:helix-turn-helix domain-containing protein [Patulibacter brassicae]|uniref:Helix-turn-helix domain-containing protein n=1 Tax=Patulibacter brassicae TaxID=1705717 RepID=A0ABU4VK76_9ACTN|nr:helix-turn-helix domain-containing protein [Patulibacter brassicae]MDX8151875.1 helix-turn-helix domain-containing protein [Patulibacter brassicae]